MPVRERQVSDMAIVIAEAGENHCGDWGMARELIRVAARAGADYVKFQLYDADAVAADDPERDWFFRVQLPNRLWKDLAAFALHEGIHPLCTPWNVEKAKIIHEVTPEAIKIASFHITDEALLRYVNQHVETVFMSTGMADMSEIERAVAWLGDVKHLYVLHCVSEYPLPPAHANLRVMDTLRARFGHRAKIGYSDHTIGIVAPVAAVAMGAEVIEKHITLDKGLPGTDHILSADPDELAEMVKQIRVVETLRGTPQKELMPDEAKIQTFMRKRFSHAVHTADVLVKGG